MTDLVGGGYGMQTMKLVESSMMIGGEQFMSTSWRLSFMLSPL